MLHSLPIDLPHNVISFSNIYFRNHIPNLTVWLSAEQHLFKCLVHHYVSRVYVVFLYPARLMLKEQQGRLRLKCDGTRAENRFRLSAKQTSPFKPVAASVQSTTGSRGVRISGSNVGYTVFRGSVKRTGYPLHSPVALSLPLPCVTVCHHISTGLYHEMPPSSLQLGTRASDGLTRCTDFSCYPSPAPHKFRT